VDFTRAAWDAARQLRSGSNTRYEGGVTSYLEVITAQNAALSDEVTAVTILGRRMASLKRSVEDGIDRICPIARDAAESS
jgi:outer membrane protein TolC